MSNRIKPNQIRIRKSPGHELIESFIEGLYKDSPELARRTVKCHLKRESCIKAFIQIDVLDKDPKNELDARTVVVGTVVDIAHTNMDIEIRERKLSSKGGNHVRVTKSGKSPSFSIHEHHRS